MTPPPDAAATPDDAPAPPPDAMAPPPDMMAPPPDVAIVMPDAFVPPDTASPPADAVGAKLSISPLSTDYGTVEVNTASPVVTFTVSNGGDTPSGAPSLTVPSEFAIEHTDCLTPLPPAGTCVVDVKMVPTSAGPKMGNLVVSATPGGTVTASLNGHGADAPKLTIQPANPFFGNVAPGQTSPAITFNVNNSGGFDSGPLSITISGTNSSDFMVMAVGGTTDCGPALPSGMSCQVRVGFTSPTILRPKLAQLDVSASPGGTASAMLTANASYVDVSPAPFDYGQVSMSGANAPTQNFTVRNLGSANDGDLTNVSAMFAGTDANMFSVATSSSCLGARVPPGLTCTFTVTFRPDSTGPKSAQLGVGAYNAAGVPAGGAKSDLTGTGIP